MSSKIDPHTPIIDPCYNSGYARRHCTTLRSHGSICRSSLHPMAKPNL